MKMDELITLAQSRFDRTGRWFQHETLGLSALTVRHMQSIESPARATWERSYLWHESPEMDSGQTVDPASIVNEP